MSETHENLSHAGGHGGHGHAEAEADRANVGVMGLILALTAIFLAVTVYLLWIYFQREAEAINYAVVLSRPSEELLELREKEAQWLHQYGVTDAAAGQYRVPIEQGKALFLKEAAARRAAGQPQVVVPAAAPAAAPAEGAAEGAQQQ